jgi:hypothetical protein
LAGYRDFSPTIDGAIICWRGGMMHMVRSTAAVLFCIFLPVVLLADCAPDYRSDKKSGLFIADVMINGTVSISSLELSKIKSNLIGACVNENSEELEERVRALFQNEGYFGASVTNLRIKPSDPLAVPKPATLETEVVEGPQYRLAEITFSGNHVVSAAALRNAFSLKKGDLFKVDKVRSGLESLRKLYVRRGFLDFTAEPGTENLSNATVRLAITVNERTQYHMGELKILAKKELADRLYGEWKLQAGSVFDFTYPDKYISANRAWLPQGFTRSDILLVQNCPDASIGVRLIVDPDSTLQSRPPDIPCDGSH